MLKIVLVDDHRIVRQGLRSLLEKQVDFRVVGEADNGRSALSTITELTPDLVIMDIGMPEMNGIDATRHVLSSLPETKIIVLSMHAEQQFVQDVMKAGAMGYLLKDSAYEELVTAIRSILAGEFYMSQKIANMVMRDYVRHLSDDNQSRSATLSTREREIWKLLAEGLTSTAIATELHISVRTVETHRQNIMEKLQLKSLADLIKLAIREGVVSLDV
ncbi:MAG TPA: response regulator transcription factor [Armatimonadota bacterium]|nr:response regulator transcription factor [Armatimonadota bacterium]